MGSQGIGCAMAVLVLVFASVLLTWAWHREIDESEIEINVLKIIEKIVRPLGMESWLTQYIEGNRHEKIVEVRVSREKYGERY